MHPPQESKQDDSQQSEEDKVSPCPVRYLLEEASHLKVPCILEDAHNGVLPDELCYQAWSIQPSFN